MARLTDLWLFLRAETMKGGATSVVNHNVFEKRQDTLLRKSENWGITYIGDIFGGLLFYQNVKF